MKIPRIYNPLLQKSIHYCSSQLPSWRRISQSDTVSISLNRAIRRGGTTIGGRDAINSLSDPSMRLAGNSIIEVKETLEKMKNLSEKATNSSLSFDDRVDLQIEMTRLQQELYEKTYGMGLGLARPNEAGDISKLVNFSVYEQGARTVLFLEKLRSGNLSGTIGKDNVKVFADGTESVSFFTSDFELDENGYLKINDVLFNNIPDLSKSMLGDMLDRIAESGALLPKWMSDQDVIANITLSLLDPRAASKSMSLINEQLDVLKSIETEFNHLASIDPTITYEYKKNASLNSEFFWTPLGIMKHQNEKNNGSLKDHADVRLVDPKDPIGKIFAKIDKLFKDKIFSSIGFGDVYKNTEKSIGISPDQLAHIEEARRKIAEKESQKVLQKSEEDGKNEMTFWNLQSLPGSLRI